MTTINRCQNCKLGQTFCVYTKIEEKETKFGKKIKIVPANNCTINKEDEYALYPDNFIDSDGIVRWRECEAGINNEVADPFRSNLYLWENISTNVTTGDMYHIEGNRYDYDHPLYHLIDYNVPMNKTGILKTNEPAHLMIGNTITLTSIAWEKDDFGEAKKVIGIPKIRRCIGLYGTVDKFTGLITHKSMKDWTSVIPEFINYTNKKVATFDDAKFNIFKEGGFDEIDEFVKIIIKDEEVRERLYDAYDLIVSGKFINVYQLLLNNDISKEDTIKIVSSVSIKNPKHIHRSVNGYRYNIQKIKELYFNIVNDVIKVDFNKPIILANIVNFILNDIELLNHKMNANEKLDDYINWYYNTALTKDLIEDLNPELINFNKYDTKNNMYMIFDIIADAIYNQKLLTIKDLPSLFKVAYDEHQSYLASYVPDKDIHEIGSAFITIDELVNITNKDAFNAFKKVMKSVDVITIESLLKFWDIWVKCYERNTPTHFWNFIEYYNNKNNDRASEKILDVLNDEESFDVNIKTDSLYFDEFKYPTEIQENHNELLWGE